jgi:hypothetical protein
VREIVLVDIRHADLLDLVHLGLIGKLLDKAGRLLLIVVAVVGRLVCLRILLLGFLDPRFAVELAGAGNAVLGDGPATFST